MQFRDLKRQYNILKEPINKAVTEVMSSGAFVMGSKVEELEQSLAEYVGVKHCVSCANGTDSLYLALRALNIGEDDIVFVPDFTFFATAEAVSRVGAQPVFVDVDPNTFNISPEKLEEEISLWEETGDGCQDLKAIITVDLFGQPADYIKIQEIAKRHGLVVIEDAAQGFGSRIGEQKACSFGTIGCTSFFPAKPLGCYGDGGALFTNDDSLANTCRSLRQHGKGVSKYSNEKIGLNSRLDAIQAAILQVKLSVFDQEIVAVNHIAELYSKLLDDSIITIPQVQEGFHSSWAQYTIILPDEINREDLQTKLQGKKIPTQIYYPTPLHLLPAYHKYATWYKCPNSLSLCQHVLSLPIHPYLTEEEVNIVAETINKIIRSNG
ncbi:MAG: DegT/DnrJ/EryC1/StrS family aminotransferase [Bacteroidales bacterium]|nr:DegT/DnrJ/EryC1/StrS family aminotransferase [Bacteroidales bacterium]